MRFQWVCWDGTLHTQIRMKQMKGGKSGGRAKGKSEVNFELLLQRLELTMQPLKNEMPALTPYAYTVIG